VSDLRELLVRRRPGPLVVDDDRQHPLGLERRTILPVGKRLARRPLTDAAAARHAHERRGPRST